MSVILEDGRGTGNKARIDSSNRLQTRSVSEPEVNNAVENGNGYNINTGLINISQDSALFYLKNNEPNLSLVFETLIIGSFDGITHSDDPYITVVRNPTGGTIISSASNVDMNQNRNFSSSSNFTGLAYKGADGDTITGGDNIAILQVAAGSRNTYPLNLVLEKGASVGFKLTANVSSGTANYYAAAVIFLKDLGVS